MHEGIGQNMGDTNPSRFRRSWLKRLGVYGQLLAGLTAVCVGAQMPAVADAEGACGNEDLRSAFGQILLPDCRAYELVSPAYKEGYPVFVVNRSIASEKAILYSLGSFDTFGDSESPLKGVLYLDRRTQSGWKLSALNAPSAEFVGEYPVAVEPTSGETLWEQHTPQESITKLGLYARSINANPAFRFIGPLNVPFEGEPTEPSMASVLTAEHLALPVAATRNYSHVVIEGIEAHWPFDTTPLNRPSLYEYSGTGNTEPILVGVNGEGKGHASLLGLCGTELGGGGFGSTYNALSNDGEAVFFTVLSHCGASAPGQNEVYARVNGALADPGPANTVDVSVSECTVSGPECADESGKNFEGASEDGRRVFFTSTQKLTNNAVDGIASGNAAEGEGCSAMEVGAGPGCNLYEYKFTATKEPPPRLAAGTLRLIAGGEVLGVSGIAEDGSRIYFVSRSAIAGAGANEFGKIPESGQPNLYVSDALAGKTNFIATLDIAAKRDWQRSFAARTTEVGGESGQYLLFESTGLLTPDTNGAVMQLFEYDAETNELVRVTKGENGYNEDGNGVGVNLPLELLTGTALQLGGGTDFKTLADRLNMSSDGRTVVFEARGQLSPRATSSEAQAPLGRCTSLYEFHSSGPLSDGAVHLISDGRETQVINGRTCGAEFQAMDASSGDIMFESIDPLSPSDVDSGQRDIYDVRVDGGFAVLGEEEQGQCGNACEGVTSATPVFGGPASASDPGEAPSPGTAALSKKATSQKPHKAKKKSGKRHKKRKAHHSVVPIRRAGR